MKTQRVSTLAVVTAVAAAVASSQAAIVWGPIADSPTTLSGSASWTGAPNPESASVTTAGGNWEVSLTFASTAKVNLVNLEGTHLVAPHAGDTAPGDTIELGLIFPLGTGSGMADGMIFHNPGASSGHKDSWTMDASSVSPKGVDVSFTATHGVPEPSTYALVAGLGLVGFAAFRRVRG